MSKKPLPVKNIIFDLGGVLVDLDFDKSLAAFAMLGIPDPKTAMGRDEDKKIFREYETGKAGTADVFAHIRSLSTKAPTDDELTAALNAMIAGFPAGRVALLRALKPKFRLFLLSNINPVHHACVQALYREKHGGNFDEHFEKPYYSHLIGRRKPDPAVYMHVITDAGLNAKETLFIDDMPENLRSASLAGLQTAHVAPGATVLDLGLEKLLTDH
ncbi:MAG: HAD family phosphatase [Alphaproteobacteria bacterium]|nr:HAD family phosphatase [Alphaproteobacteria bacterium]MDE2335766.1 HAD family phosphatase [Alphaproteobacteria bacterium]